MHDRAELAYGEGKKVRSQATVSTVNAKYLEHRLAGIFVGFLNQQEQ